MSTILTVAELRIEAAERAGSEVLDLSGLRLTCVPEGVAGLVHLRELRLSDNRLGGTGVAKGSNSAYPA